MFKTTLTEQKILYIQYTNPGGYPPLEHSSRILAEEGWQVLFLGTGAFGASDLCFPPHPNITVQLMPFCSAGWQQKLHYLQFCFWVLIWTLRWQPQWVYASDLLSCPISILLSFFNTKIIYHEHDSPNATSDSFFIRFCLKNRKWLAKKAKICIIPNEQRIDRFKKVIGDRQNIFCVWNCPSKEEVCQSIQADNSNELWVWYHGSIVPVQLPPTILSALAILPDRVKLRVVGYETVGHPNYVKQLQQIACEMGISERIEYIGTLPTREKLLESCQKCNIGIALFPKDSLQPMPGASNKPFEYLASGLPLLVSDLPDWKQMYVDTGYGLACNPDDPESIAASLKWYLEHPAERQKMGDRGRQRIWNEWNYEQQFMQVRDQICYF
ncbi:glycosyltransferase [Nostoc sp. C117]|uniref:glycosyltransferase n=1 Tax=Nostoc sp. C117 TaxID=3349875 RepID=UPI00370DC121